MANRATIRYLAGGEVDVRPIWWLWVVACNKQPDPEWVRFNGEDDTVEVEVVDGPAGDAVTADITSSTGTSLIGDVWVNPGSGPPGTEHEIRVSVAQEYADRVQRAEIVVYSPNGGVFAYPMEQDSAEQWRWVLWVESTEAEAVPHLEALQVDLYELITPPVVQDDGGGISIFDF